MPHLLKLLRFITPYRKQAIGALILLTLMVFLDLMIPRLIQRIIDQGIRQHNMSVVVTTALIMIGISLVSVLVAIANNILSVKAGEGVARDLREALFVHIQKFSAGNPDKLNTGQLMVRLTSDVGAFQRLTLITLRIGTRAPLMLIGSFFLMVHTSGRLALTVLPLLFITGVIIFFFITRMEPLFQKTQQKLDRLNTILQENISGVRLVKAFARSVFENSRFAQANQEFTDQSVSVMWMMAVMTPILTVFINLGVVVVIWVGGYQTESGDLTVGQVVAFINYLAITTMPLVFMTMLSNVWAGALVSAKRINEVLENQPEIQDASNAVILPENNPGRIVFENVSFRYQSSGEAILKEISFTAEPGKMLAILGSTGSGKSTLINLILRHYDVTSGRILLDGVDIRLVQQDSLYRLIGVVPQESILFTGTILDNIRYGSPRASEAEAIAAAEIAQADGFIREMPNGYHNHVEQRGVNLSGGQKQRLAIARALLAYNKVLILDDSTSSVDVETETRIQNALETHSLKITRIVVAQRVSTVLKADKILVLDQGRLAASGTHTQLMESSSIYQEIYSSQLGNGHKFTATIHDSANKEVINE